jgi:SagB-type dehydrogenase family enzyme
MATQNHDFKATWSYHNATKHSYETVRTNRHYLDWENQPLPYKIYRGLDPISLADDVFSAGLSALAAAAMLPSENSSPGVPDLRSLTEIFYFSAGVTKRKQFLGGEMFFRAAACTGALYHIDLYLVCGELDQLPAGVYHFGPHDFSLRRLRAGDHRAVLGSSTADLALQNAPAIVVCTSTFWRNAWKYQARTYRHCFWDSGTIVANLLATAASRKIAARVVLGFVDATVNDLLGLDARREAALALIPLGQGSGAVPAAPAITALELQTDPLSKSEVDYPAIRAMHEASSLETEEEVVAWREAAAQAIPVAPAPPSGRLFLLRPLAGQDVPVDSLEEVIMRRGSTRRFARAAITLAQLSTMLEHATRGIPADFAGADAQSLNELYLIINAVEGLPSGAYVYNRKQAALELLKEGEFRREAGHLGLGQEIPEDAGVDVFFLTDLKPVLERFGNRGYRAAQLEAAITGGKLYLGAYALGLGASGLTFFDDDVTEFFSPHAAGKSVMFLVALCKPAKREIR